jgi:hypothetical protein
MRGLRGLRAALGRSAELLATAATEGRAATSLVGSTAPATYRSTGVPLSWLAQRWFASPVQQEGREPGAAEPSSLGSPAAQPAAPPGSQAAKGAPTFMHRSRRPDATAPASDADTVFPSSMDDNFGVQRNWFNALFSQASPAVSYDDPGRQPRSCRARAWRTCTYLSWLLTRPQLNVVHRTGMIPHMKGRQREVCPDTARPQPDPPQLSYSRMALLRCLRCIAHATRPPLQRRSSLLWSASLRSCGCGTSRTRGCRCVPHRRCFTTAMSDCLWQAVSAAADGAPHEELQAVQKPGHVKLSCAHSPPRCPPRPTPHLAGQRAPRHAAVLPGHRDAQGAPLRERGRRAGQGGEGLRGWGGASSEVIVRSRADVWNVSPAHARPPSTAHMTP